MTRLWQCQPFDLGQFSSASTFFDFTRYSWYHQSGSIYKIARWSLVEPFGSRRELFIRNIEIRREQSRSFVLWQLYGSLITWPTCQRAQSHGRSVPGIAGIRQATDDVRHGSLDRESSSPVTLGECKMSVAHCIAVANIYGDRWNGTRSSKIILNITWSAFPGSSYEASNSSIPYYNPDRRGTFGS